MDQSSKIDEPHIILCVDGNFQHRCHQAAGHELQIPELFMETEEVESMANAMAVGRTQDPQLDELVVSVQSNLSECPHPITLMSSH